MWCGSRIGKMEKIGPLSLKPHQGKNWNLAHGNLYSSWEISVIFMTSCVWTFCSSWLGGHTCKVSTRSVQPLQKRRFLKVFLNFKTMWLPNHVTDDIIKFFFLFSVDHFIPRWPSKIFMLIRCSVLHVQLWGHNEGTHDVLKITLIPHEEYLPFARFQSFPCCGFRDTEDESFSIFQHDCHTTWPMTS